jgi:RHS repeat-associated protein
MTDGSLPALSIGCDLRSDPTNGSLSATIPLQLPEGRGGFGPRLQLEYGSSGPNGAFGVGWRLGGLLNVAVDTAEGLPRYDGQDTFRFTAGGQLVPVTSQTHPNLADGWQDHGDYLVRRFRARFERGHHRVEQWLDKVTRRVHWVTRDASGTVTIYGLAADGLARISNPDDPQQVFLWNPEMQYDVHGNAIRFDYAAETLDGVNPADVSEAHRIRGGVPLAQRYLKRIRWGNTRPVAQDGVEPPGQQWCFELVFDYGDHDDAAPRPAPDRAWRVRPDPFSTCTSGFELRSYRLSRRLLLFHHFEALGPDPVLVQSYELQHAHRAEGSTLMQLRKLGFRRMRNGTTASKSYPPLRFDYSESRVPSAFQMLSRETQETLPHGLDGPRYHWIDLYGEGLPGVLVETPDAWYFKRNEGGGRFGREELVLERPAYALGRVSIQDFDGDGNPDLAVVSGRSAGYYEFDPSTERWRGFRPFLSIPHLEAANAHAQWLDLNGDGRADLLLASPDRITWFPSLGKEGFAAGFDLQPSRAIENGSAIAPWRDDPALNYFFADMNGDGFPDQVLVRNGLVMYWPNLGYGRFGTPVIMEGAPRFAAEGEFDAGRLLFADLDGSGTADLLYLGHGEITYWTNACGNRLLEGRTLRGLPHIDNLATLRILDFLGDGTPCLVWSTPLPSGISSLHYLPLTDGVKSRLLISVDNSMGLVRRISYGTSATHYLSDRARGVPWQTRLATHVTVVEAAELVDEIGGARTVSRYAYHDGSFDSRERRFVGFGCVESFDTEMEGEGGSTGPPTTPSCTRTFLHLGWEGPPSLERAWRGDPSAPVLAAHAFDFTTPLTEDEVKDGLAAVAGQVIRQEVFAIEADGRVAPHPFRVDQFGFQMTRLQPAGAGRRASFTVQDREQLTAVYEQQPNDPRITHRLTLQTDAYGVPTLGCTIAYPRRAGITVADPAQQRTHATVERTRVVHLDEPNRFRLNIGIEHESFDIADLARPPSGVFAWTDVQAQVAAALAAPVPHDEPAPAPTAARRTGWMRTYYWNDAGTDAAPFGSAGFPVRLHHVEEAAFSTRLVNTVYGIRVDAARLQADGFYAADEDHWWRAGETFMYGDAPAFFRVESIIRPDSGTTRFVYDASSLMAVETIDAVGNRVRIIPDYFVMAPGRTVDENENLTEAEYDPLGMPLFVTRRGEVLDENGVARPYGFDLLATIAPRPGATPESVVADPADHLQGAAQASIYDLDRWARDREPPVIVRLVREMMTHDGSGAPAAPGDVLVSVVHIDGFGRTIQEKLRVEPGLAISRGPDGSVALDAGGQPVLAPAPERWLVSGNTVYNAKQETARQYEPYFSPSWRFEPDQELSAFGVAHNFFYDAQGREIRHEYPNGTLSRAEYSAWSLRAYDANDTVDESLYRLLREALPPTEPEREALERTLPHADTPVVVHFDPHGRDVVRTESSGDGAERRVRTVYAPDGQIAEVIDPRGITSLRFTRDMLGRVLRTESSDSGVEIVLPDAFDRVAEGWDACGVHVVRGYDVLDRLLTVDVDGVPGLDRRVQEYLYGEDSSVTDAELRNARGRVVRCRDEAGTRGIQQYTPAGEIAWAVRRVLSDPESPADWRDPTSVALLPDEFASRFAYDGLDRPLRQMLADGSTLAYRYSRSSGLLRAAVSTDDGLLADEVIFEGAEFNPRGQRAQLRLGNGVTITHTYEAESWRTRRIQARKAGTAAGSLLQDLEFTYDPVGNILRSVDHVHQPTAVGPYLSGLNTSAERFFRYDGFYQLREATGRIHRAALPTDHRTDPPNAGTRKGGRRVSLNDGGQLERYVQTFGYDLSGNLTSMRHQGPMVNWTRQFWVSASSNRSLPALDANGLPIVAPENHFDSSGNCVRLSHLRRMVWDYRGMPSHAVVIDRSSSGQPDDDELYLHDAGGSRVRKVSRRMVEGGAVEVTDVLYLDGCEIKRIRRNTTGLLERRSTHVHDGFNRVALVHRWTTDVNARETDDVSQPRIHYQLSDHTGSALLQLDRDANVIAYEEYLPYGNTAFIAGDDDRDVAARDYRYCGKERDDATGLYYFGYRYYAPWLGRWMSPDPAGTVDGLNLYQYARNNPISNYDPDGLQTTQTRGREVPVAMPVPGEVTAAFAALPQPEQERLRGLMRRGNFAWLYDANTRQFHFGSRAEIQRRVDALTGAGQNVGRIVPPGEGSSDADSEGAEGGRRRRGATRQQGSQGSRGGSRARRGTRTSPTPGRGSRRHTSGSGAGAGTAQADGTEGVARGPGGTAADSTGTGGAEDPGGNAVDPGDGTGADTTSGTGGGGTGTGGTGPGASAQSGDTGTGGGGTEEGPEAIGMGDTGSGTGGGEGAGSGEGSGTEPGVGEGAGTSNGAGDGGTGLRGTGQGTRPGGVPGGDPAGQVGGQPNGVVGGTLGGAATGEPGTGSTQGTPGNEPTATGDPNGPRGGVGSGPGGSTSRQGEGGRGEQPGGGRGGGARQRPTAMDRVVRVAGWWHLEFSGSDEGESGGIPGGMGSLNLGSFGQALFVALTVADIVLTVLTLGGLAAIKTGLRAAAMAARRLMSTVVRRAGAALRLGMRSLLRGGRRTLEAMVDFAARGTTTRAFERAPLGQFRLRDLSIGLGDWRIHTNRIWLDPSLRGIQRAATFLHESVHWLSNQFLPNLARFKQFTNQPGWRGFIGSNVKFYEESVAYTVGGTIGSLSPRGWAMGRPFEIFGFHAAWTRSLGGAPVARRHVLMGLPFVGGGAAVLGYSFNELFSE